MMQSLPQGYRALVFGASGAIGEALVNKLGADPRGQQVHALSRHSDLAFDLLNEDSMAVCAAALAHMGPFHLVIDATGALMIDGLGPEKRLDELNADHLLRAMQLNAVGPALLLKHFSPLLASGERVIWAKLSARVGSIEDNRKGGWYGYRAAKAALNMLLQTAAIEIARRRPLAVVAALQPGTVRSALSQPFVGDDALAPQISAQGLLQALDAALATGRAVFLDHQGHCIPW
jgi:NAD(P)-dependent dehydrogenase (short-subunit alcohol dehydrogenase family)